MGLSQLRRTWNIGDRTAVSNGWLDPIDNSAPEVFNIGAFFNRNDRTNFYVGYRNRAARQQGGVELLHLYLQSQICFDFGGFV